MKRALVASLGILILASSVICQKASTILGKTFTGVVVSSNEATRELTLSYTDTGTNNTETFSGVLKEGYMVRLRDGTRRELLMSDLKPGLRVRIIYKEKSENVGGQKVKLATIISVDFLGRDQYTTLREALGVAPNFPVTLLQSDKLPDANPLKLYVAIFEPYIKKRLIDWVGQWNKEQGAKYGQIDIVPDLAQSDVAAVFFWGADEGLGVFPLALMYDPHGTEFEVYQATVHLVTKDADSIKVWWLKVTGESRRKLEGVQEGQIERELEKRMKARGKK
jgi:hypothetical protein